MSLMTVGTKRELRRHGEEKNKADVWLSGRVTESGAVFKGLSLSPISYKFGRSHKVAKQERGAGGGRKQQKHEKPEHTVE